MEELTAKEEEVMQVIWNLEKALVRDIMSQLPNSKPTLYHCCFHCQNPGKERFCQS